MWVIARAGLILWLLSTTNARADLPTWLAGCWQSPDGSAREVWVIESNRSLLGFSATVQDNRIGFYELMRIHRADDDGRWIFTAWPSSQAPTSFRSTAAAHSSITFSNPDHDYPQVIRYARGEDALEATISLADGAKLRRFTRIACQ